MRIWMGVLLVGLLWICVAATPVIAQRSEEGKDTRIQLGEDERFIYLVEESERFPLQGTGRVAVALGGGGARALVNIGVLKALEEAQIPVDFVVGTSMGAIVAVLYGSGIPVQQIEELVTRVNLPSMFYLNFPFNKSLLNTTEINEFIERVAPYKRLEDFPIPTALLSYDLNEGVRYIATTGPAHQRVGGPYAIPLCFPGEREGDHFLIDAGVWELTPAGAARALGADLVIATTAYDALPYDDYASSLRSWTRMINLIKENNAREIVQGYADVEIAHEVGDYSFMDFHLAQQFIDLGYRETQKQLPTILELLAKRGIPLRTPAAKTEISMDHLMQDLANNRMAPQPFMVKPVFSVGKDRSVFAPQLFSNSSYLPRYGLELEYGHLEHLLVTYGLKGNLWEWEGKWKKFTPNTDLHGQARWESGGMDWELGLSYYQNDSRWYLGYRGEKQIHAEHTYHSLWNGWTFGGETDLWYDFRPSTGEPGLIGVTAQEVEIPLSGHLTFHPKMVLSNAQDRRTPTIYRGASGEGQVTMQGSVEWIYEHRFPYSLEVMQLVQVTGVNLFPFVDIQRASQTDWAVGGGVAADLNLLGIKPSRLGGFASFEPQKGAFRAGFDLDFTF